jgi:pilus assembly protein CpaF
MPFTIIISEKGGAERRESFDKTEINVGRVQGNDLMLPKGNVSKHHARLLYRDGRFIVTDLKSTNGTYVNGRKITQATIVREGDKIYIGDFVIRLDLGGAQAGQAEDQPTAIPAQDDGPRGPMPPNMPPLPQQMPMGQPPPMPQPMMGAPPPQMQMPPLQPMAGPMHTPMAPMQPQGPMPGMHAPPPAPQRGAPMPQQARGPAGGDQLSHYPLERDPDDNSDMAAAPSPQVPPAPRMPQGGRGTLAMGGAPPPPQQVPGISPQSPPAARPSALPPQPSSSPPAVRPQPSTPSMQKLPPKESPQQAGRRLALVTLVDRVADVVNLSTLRGPHVEPGLAEGINRAAKEQANGMREEGEVPEGVDLEVLVKDAVRELVGLGAVGPLLEDDDVSEIHCLRHDQVLMVKAGQLAIADYAFTKDEAVGLAIERLAVQAGEPVKPGERVIERRLPKGAHMIAFLPPTSSMHALVIRKRRKVEMALEDFVRLAAMSRQMATFLEQCLAARANVLACAPGQLGAMFVGAMASGSAGDRVALLQDNEEFSISHAHVVSLGLGADRETVVRGAARLRPDRIVIGALAGSVVGATVEAIAEGAEGVLAAMSAPSLRQALTRLVGQLTMARPGVSVEAAREIIGESFDVAVELVTLPDGRYRVTRIAELAGSDAKGVVARDIFVAGQADGPDAGHMATGVVPRITAEFAARGVRMDPNLFKKGR